MEPKSKLMAITICGEGRRGCVENGSMKDRLSSLPDEVAHHILSVSAQNHRLEMKDSALFICVSKRCRELVLSNPTLRIYDPFATTSTCIERLEFMNSLDRLLANRGDNKLQLFDSVWYPHYSTGTPCFCKNEKFRIIIWIHNVLRRCKVETLSLFIENSYSEDDALPAFPSYIFHSESSTSLMTSGFNMGYWKLQDLAFFDQLKEFTMELWEGSNGIELARYILENAQNLEKMVIVHLPEHSDVEREFSKSKIISNATLVFKSVPYYTVDP